jgi:hypothetical protein
MEVALYIQEVAAMTATDLHAAPDTGVGKVDMKLEIDVIPVPTSISQRVHARLA